LGEAISGKQKDKAGPGGQGIEEASIAGSLSGFGRRGMNEGRIVEYIDQGKFICALCLQDRGKRLHLLTPSNREINLPPKRAILISDPAIDIGKPREELLEMLHRAEEIRSRLKREVNVEELWELVRDEGETFDYRYLAQLAFGEDVTSEHLSALVRALFENRLHFKMKEGCFVPNSEKRIHQLIKQKEEEARRQQMLDQGSKWLREVLYDSHPEPPPFKEKIISLLIQLALYGNESPDFKLGKEMLLKAGMSDVRNARNLLIKLGVWDEDENLELLRFGIETSFPEAVMAESALLSGSEVHPQGYEDLRDLEVVTIDGPETRDYDDALSLEKRPGGIELGIHIADVASAIPAGSRLDREASERGSSLYLPRRQIPMIPVELSQNFLSLKQDLERPAISLFVRFDDRGKMLDYRFVTGIIRVKRRLTYDQVTEMLDRESVFAKMYEISRLLRQSRADRGALSLSLPELHISFDSESSFSVELVDQNSPSRIIVAELMILYNHLMAKFCVENRIPILFRTQSEPSERLSPQEHGYIFYVFRQRRKLSPLQIETEPKPHCGLGLDIYTQTTSPIRRYLDLVVQRQVRNFLTGSPPPYDGKQLEEIRISVEPTIKNLQLIKRKRLRYWVLKFLAENQGKVYNALVLDELKSRYRLVLTDFLIIADIKRQNGMILNPGQEIRVRVDKADPWEDRLDLTWMDE